MREYAKDRMEKGKNDEGEEQLLEVFWALSQLYADCSMRGEQRARFEDACSCVSEIGWPWEKYGQTDGGCDGG